MTPEELIATLSLTLPGRVLREALRGHVITTGHEDGIRLEKALDAAALAVAHVVVEHVLRELKMKPEPGELPRVAVQCWGCEGKPSGDNNPCDVCGRRSIP